MYITSEKMTSVAKIVRWIFLHIHMLPRNFGKEFMMILYRQLRFVHSLFSEEAKISMNIWGFAIVGLSAYSLGHKN